jgi:lysophospholipase L1-like esterase
VTQPRHGYTPAASTGSGGGGGGVTLPQVNAAITAAQALTHPAVPAYNLTPGNLVRWRAALANVRQGIGQAKILCIGDSTTLGAGSGVLTAYPARLASLLNTPTVIGFAPARATNTPDLRWTLGAGWSFVTNAGGFGGGQAYTATTGAGGALSFTPGLIFDTVDVYFAGDPAAGTAPVTVNNVTTTLNTAVTAGFRKQTISVSPGQHTISIGSPTGTVSIFGIDAYLSSASQVRVGNAGRSGSTADMWTSTALPANALAGITTHAPDLVIYMTGINENGYLTDAQLRTHIETIGTTVEGLGASFIIMSPVPSNEAAAPGITANQQAFRAMMRTVSDARGWPFIDLNTRLGSYTTINGLGWMADDYHPNAGGYADMAIAVAGALNTVEDSVSPRVTAVSRQRPANILWNTGDQICVPDTAAAAAGNVTMQSGQPSLMGGPGMIVPAGVQVQGVTFVANSGPTTPTAMFAFIAVPDPTGLARATIVAVSNDFGATAWTANTARKFSFRPADGGSGFWAPVVDTPIYAGLVQVAATPGVIRGIAGSAFVNPLLMPKWACVSGAAGSMTTPPAVGTVLILQDIANSANGLFARVSSTYN